MAAAGEGTITYEEVEEYFNSLEAPSAQERIDFIVPYLISLLPQPSGPASETDDASASDSDDDHFSLTSSESEASYDAADEFTGVPFARDDGEDYISCLPDDLLINIVSRLPAKQAVLTTVLSTRWRGVWAATPLLIDDAQLKLTNGPRGAQTRDLYALRAISRCVESHPGPVRSVRVTRLSFHMHEYALQRIVAILAAKKVEDLILFNRPWPIDMPLPDDILQCTSLSRLYLGIWSFPDTTKHPPALANLRELGLFHTLIGSRDLKALLAHGRKLEILSLAMVYDCPFCLRIASHSLRVVMEWMCAFTEVVVDDAPCLERLILKTIIPEQRTVKIISAPMLRVLGFLDLQFHVLEIGGIVIEAGMNVRDSAILPSLKILAVKVRFSDDGEAKMLPTLLKCFPRLETLHIMSVVSELPDSGNGLEFWESLGSCDCLKSHLKTIVLHGFHGQNHEELFFSYIRKEGKALKNVGIICSDSHEMLVERGLMPHSLVESDALSSGTSRDVSVFPASDCWSFQNAINLSVEDPFAVLLHPGTAH